jgi:hypothetical protein
LLHSLATPYLGTLLTYLPRYSTLLYFAEGGGGGFEQNLFEEIGAPGLLLHYFEAGGGKGKRKKRGLDVMHEREKKMDGLCYRGSRRACEGNEALFFARVRRTGFISRPKCRAWEPKPGFSEHGSGQLNLREKR